MSRHDQAGDQQRELNPRRATRGKPSVDYVQAVTAGDQIAFVQVGVEQRVPCQIIKPQLLARGEPAPVPGHKVAGLLVDAGFWLAAGQDRENKRRNTISLSV